MKKKIIKIISIFTLVLLMSGCVKYNANIKITNDKKMNMELIIAASKSLQNDTNEDDTTNSTEDNSSIDELVKKGWKQEEYEDSDYIGTRLTKTYNNIDDISTTSEVEYDLNSLVQDGKESKYMFYKKTSNGKTTYIAKFKGNINDAKELNNDSQDEEETSDDSQEIIDDDQYDAMVKQMLKTMDLKISVEVPRVISSNATETNENKLTWDLTKLDDDSNIEFEFELDDNKTFFDTNSLPTMTIIGCAGIIFLLIIIIIILLITRNKNTKKENENTNVMEPVKEVNQNTNIMEPVKEVNQNTNIMEPVKVVEKEQVNDTPTIIEQQEVTNINTETNTNNESNNNNDII